MKALGVLVSIFVFCDITWHVPGGSTLSMMGVG